MPTKVYDRTIEVLKSALISAKLGSDERLDAIRRLDEQARRLKRHSTDPLLPDIIAVEQQRSHEYGGRSVSAGNPRPYELKAVVEADRQVFRVNSTARGDPATVLSS